MTDYFIVNFMNNLYRTTPMVEELNLNRFVNQRSAKSGRANPDNNACCVCFKQVKSTVIIRKKNGVYYAFCDEHRHEGMCRNDPGYLEWINRDKDTPRVIPEDVGYSKIIEVTYPQLSPYIQGSSIEGRICTTCCLQKCINNPATLVRDSIPICKNCDEDWDMQEAYLTDGPELASFRRGMTEIRNKLQTGQKEVKVNQVVYVVEKML